METIIALDRLRNPKNTYFAHFNLDLEVTFLIIRFKKEKFGDKFYKYLGVILS